MRYFRYALWAIALGWTVFCATTKAVHAQGGGAEPPDDKAPPTVRLNVRPAAAPRPALRYQLLPNVRERRPGNAAVHYNKLGLNYPGADGETKDFNQEWLEVPLAELPRDQVRAFLDSHRAALDDIELASRREQCDWELPIRERDYITLLLPEAQRVRSYARLLQLQARLQIAEGQCDEALRTLKAGYAMGRQVASGGTIINGLVGMAVCGVMSKQLEDLIQQPGAPNIYWALTTLPHPLVDLRPGFEAEQEALYLSYPEFADLENRDRRPEYWQRLTDRLLAFIVRIGGEESKTFDRLVLTARVIKGYPVAKQYLIDDGRSPEEVEAMPVAQVVAIYTMRFYDEYRDEMFKWLSLPFWQARAGLESADESLRHGMSREILPLAGLLLPAVAAISQSSARSERAIAMLRVVEAVRLYGASHDGQLPARLADVVVVPIPLDPLTGGPFIYRLEADMAVLEAPLPQGIIPRHYGARFEIKFVK
ncbi:MAG TPA: hypothetical protein VGX78_02185 [Pirellulales bacterium]|jgi:hypothetical protein|nr:hypothetical protein [Pirellulales bacterium]